MQNCVWLFYYCTFERNAVCTPATPLTSLLLISTEISNIKVRVGKNEAHYTVKLSKDILLFVTAIWLSHGQLWAILEGTASLTRC